VQLRDPPREILLSAVTTSEQAESTIRTHRRHCCQLNCHTKQTVWIVDAARKRAMEVNVSFQPHSGRLGSRSTKQTEINSTPCLTCAIQRFLIAGQLRNRSQITRPDLPTQVVSRQLPIYPTISTPKSSQINRQTKG
jgi:hypothetical protein